MNTDLVTSIRTTQDGILEPHRDLAGFMEAGLNALNTMYDNAPMFIAIVGALLVLYGILSHGMAARLDSERDRRIKELYSATKDRDPGHTR